MKDERTTAGYGNLYTPHSGSMIISMQREGGLENRTFVVSSRGVRILRFLTSRSGKVLGGLLVASWILFAYETARVPFLQHRLTQIQSQTARLDTLQRTLDQLQQRYAQVQIMLGAGTTPTKLTPDKRPTVPTIWPIAAEGFVSRGEEPQSAYAPEHQGVDIAVPDSTQVLAAGGGVVTQIDQSAELGNYMRIQHAEGYETLYAHLSKVLVTKGDVVAGGSPIALSGNSGRSTAPHLHFELRRDGHVLDPMQLAPKG